MTPLPQTAPFAERRVFPRYSTSRNAWLWTDSGEFSVTLVDISGGGARIRVTPTATAALKGREFTLKVEGFGTVKCDMRWTSDSDYGLEFRLPADAKSSVDTALRTDPRSRANPT